MTERSTTMSDEELVRRGEMLARQAASQGVLANQLGLVLSHLNRHRDVKATLALVQRLPRSAFAHRNRDTPGQFESLNRLLRAALRGCSWRNAAGIVGWAQRLLRAVGSER